MSRCSREALSDVRQWSRVHPGCLEIDWWPSRMSSSGWEALLKNREWSRGPPGCPESLADAQE